MLTVISKITDNARELWQEIDAYVRDKVGYISGTNGFTLISEVVRDLFQVHKLNMKLAYQENNVLMAQNAISIRGIAQESGHFATRPISSTGVVSIKFNSQSSELGAYLIIGKGATLKSDYNGLLYTTTKEYYITPTPYSRLDISVIEGEQKSKVFTNYARKELSILRLDDTQAIDYTTIKVVINGITWSQYVSIYDMNYDTKGYVVRNGFDNQIDILFGDGVNGMIPENGAIPEVFYTTTNGESGNIDTSAEINTFSFVDGIIDQNGVSTNIDTTHASIYVSYGFVLGSNGENIEKTRALTGYSSRSNVFAQPNNLKAYISRFSVVGGVDVWFDSSDYSIMNMLAVRKVSDYINNDTNKYYELLLSDIILSDEQKKSLLLNIENSGHSVIGNEIMYIDPTIKKYAMYVFITQDNTRLGIDNDYMVYKKAIRDAIKTTVANYMIENSLNNITKFNESNIISKNKLESTILSNIDSATRCSVSIFSEDNETAMYNGYYNKSVIVNSGGISTTVVNKITLTENQNPKLGLTDLDDIIVSKKEIALLKSIKINTSDGDYIDVDAVTVLVSDNGYWQQI